MKRTRRAGRGINEDRLSDLPDSILLHMLGFMNTKHVVRTCVLSKRWKDLWKHVPALLVKSSQFKRIALFKEFVTKFLSCRDGSDALYSLDFKRRGPVEPQILERIVRYAVSHNVQQLSISTEYHHELPLTIFSCQSLTSLKLSVCPRIGGKLLIPKSFSLMALTNLHLEYFAFCPGDDGLAEPFSNCKKLHSLVINYFTLKDAQTLCISNARVANLAMHYYNRDCKIVLSTPNLRSLSFASYYPPTLDGSNLSFLEKVCIDVGSHGVESALILNSLLQMFSDVKSMTLSSSTLRVLSLMPDLRNMQFPCFGNLNSLNVHIKRPYLWKRMILKPPSPTIHYEVVDYLLQNSPSAQVTIIEC